MQFPSLLVVRDVFSGSTHIVVLLMNSPNLATVKLIGHPAPAREFEL